MNNQKNLRDRYIQLVETFITAIESGRSGDELENIRKEIRMLSSALNSDHAVENPSQVHDILTHKQKADESKAGADAAIN